MSIHMLILDKLAARDITVARESLIKVQEQLKNYYQ